MIDQLFSTRQGYRPENKPITVREEAPRELREAILMLAKRLEMRVHDMRDVVCEVLLVTPNPDNRSEHFVWLKIEHLVYGAAWYKVYDVAESFYTKLMSDDQEAAIEFGCRLNEFFLEKGIGWEIQGGEIVYRGSEVFANSTHKTPQSLEKVGFLLAASEMREALRCISRRPDADVTGAIQHAMVALETTAREVVGDRKSTLGKLTSELNLPGSLKGAIDKLWGYTSNWGRHISEGQNIDYGEAELVVAIAGSLRIFRPAGTWGNRRANLGKTSHRQSYIFLMQLRRKIHYRF
ncbi:MAG: hypothetical protein OXH34_03065 [Bacteroidetes bacterium]|nr:hypothetical protein [Bacteroidota bacterium]